MFGFFQNVFSWQGDRNVEKVLNEELRKDDWALFIMHFLGLDHIGHVEGSISGKIDGKLLQMDGIVEKIVKNRVA